MARILLLLLAVLMAGCVSDQAACAGEDCQTVPQLAPAASPFAPWAEEFRGPLRFVVGDTFEVTLPFYEDESTTATVTPDGSIYIALLGKVPAAGRTAQELQGELKQRYAQFLRFPDVGIVPTTFASRQVYVGGEVNEPGVYPLSGPIGVLEAIYAAGGLTTGANPGNVVLIRRGPNQLPMMKYLDVAAFAKQGLPTENTLLQPFDIVVVPRSRIADINLFVLQYVEGIVPFGHNFSYNVWSRD